MLKKIFSAITILFCGINVANATIYTDNIYWLGGESAGQLAGVCNFDIPENRPFAVNKTLVVDNSLPINSVIYSWEYGNYLNFSITCKSSGIQNSTSEITHSNTTQKTMVSLAISSSGSGVTAPYDILTTNSGINVKYTYKFNNSPVPCENCLLFPSSGDSSMGTYLSTTRFNYNDMSAGSETGKTRYQDMINSNFFVVIKAGVNKYQFADTVPSTLSFSIKAELIKVGNISYDDNPLRFRPGYGGSFQVFTTTGSIYNTNFDVGGAAGGITIVRPTCQLKTKDYNIAMNSWVSVDPSVSPGAFPAYGGQIPVNIEMECSGQVDDTQISFEDANSATPRQDVGLYDTAGGTPIDGLAIQLLHNNAPVPTDKTKTVISGLGATKTVADSMPLFDSTSIVNFSARYVQTGAIKMNGTDYTGPVTGKLNIWVTYN